MDRVIEILGSVGFDWRVAFANLVNFSIVLWLVSRFIVPSIRATLAERRAKIEQGVSDAEEAARQLEEAREHEREIVRDATLKSSDLVSEARVRGDLIISNARDEGARAGVDMIRRAEDEIARKYKELESSIERDAVALVVDGVRKVLISGLDEAGNAALIKGIIDRSDRTV